MPMLFLLGDRDQFANGFDADIVCRRDVVRGEIVKQIGAAAAEVENGAIVERLEPADRIEPRALRLRRRPEQRQKPARVSSGCVVCRAIDDDGSIWFVSDARSKKNRQIKLDRRVEAVFWLPNLKLQFRIRGEARVVGASEPRTIELWQALPD